MRFNISIDCTPEEARRAIGLPDLSPLHDSYVAALQEAMAGKIRPETIEAMMRGWVPMGEAGMAIWRSLIDHAATGAGSAR